MRKNLQKCGPWWILIPFMLMVIMFLLLPFLTILNDSFIKDGDKNYSFYNYSYIFKNKLYVQSILNSIKLSLISTLVGGIIAIQGAYSISRLGNRIRDKFLLLSNMISNFSGVPLAFAFILLLGTNGVFTLILKNLNLIEGFSIYSEAGVTLAYIYFQIPLGILLLYPSFDAIKDEWKEMAIILGATKFHYWRKIVLPVIAPSIIGTSIILFANAMGAYATVYGITGTNYNLLSLRISNLIAGDVTLKPNLAAALGIILTTMLVVIILSNEIFIKNRGSKKWKK